MHFHIRGLDPERFAPLFTDPIQLAARGGRRVLADAPTGFPCRVSLADARPGDELVLVPFEHHAAASPYRASGPIFVRRGAEVFDAVDRVPEMLRSRQLSVRAYDARGDLVRAEVCPGAELEPTIEELFAAPEIRTLHVHFAKPGCFACRVDRAAHGRGNGNTRA